MRDDHGTVLGHVSLGRKLGLGFHQSQDLGNKRDDAIFAALVARCVSAADFIEALRNGQSIDCCNLALEKARTLLPNVSTCLPVQEENNILQI